MSDDPLGDATHPQSLESAAPVRPHDEQVVVSRTGPFQDDLGGKTERHLATAMLDTLSPQLGDKSVNLQPPLLHVGVDELVSEVMGVSHEPVGDL